MYTSFRVFGPLKFMIILRLLAVWASLAVLIVPPSWGARAAHAASSQSASSDYEPGQLLVKFRPTTKQANLSEMLAQADFKELKIQRVTLEIPQANLYHLYFASSVPVTKVMAQLQKEAGVSYAAPNYIYRLQDWPGGKAVTAKAVVYDHQVNDSYRNVQYYLDISSIPQAWTITTGSNVTVAVEDSGVELNHPDLVGRIRSDGYNFVNNNGDVSDVLGHGTEVSGLIAANSDNHIGIAGISWAAQILPVKVATPQGTIDVDVAAEGIYYAIAHGARILNLSYGGETSTPVLQDAINYALSKEAIIIAAAGNAPDGLPEYPAAYPGVIAVTATDEADRIAFFDSYGAYVTLGAPGVDIMTTSLNQHNLGDYTEHSGTSFSAPIVSGVVALMLTLNPNLRAGQVRQALVATADKVYPTNDDFYKDYGAGRLNAYHAMEYAANLMAGPLATAVPAQLLFSQQLTPNATVKPGDALSLQVNVLNAGAGAANHIYMNVPIDAALQLQYVVMPPHVANVWVSSVSSHYFTMQLGSLEASAAISFTAVYRVKPEVANNTPISFADSGNWSDAAGGGTNIANSVTVAVGQSSDSRPANFTVQMASPASGQAGQLFELNTDGFTAGETVAVWLNRPDGSVMALPATKAGNQGQVAISFDSKGQTQSGDYSLVAHGQYSKAEIVAHFSLTAAAK